MVSNSSICLRCFTYHQHDRHACRRNAVICCSRCFRMNYLTRDCCNAPQKPSDDEYPQVFRMVGVNTTCFFTDIKIGTKFVSALLDTNMTTSRVDWAVVNLLSQAPNYHLSLSENTIPIPVSFNKRIVNLACEYGTLSNPIQMELGMDYLVQSSAAMKLDGLFVTPMVKGRPSKTKEARYIIYVSIYGKMFEAIIDTGIPQSRVDVTLLSAPEKRKNKLHVYDLRKSTITVDLQMKWQDAELDMCFIVGSFATNGPKIRLGTDFLMQRRFHFILNGIDLDINSPWKTSNPDNIEFIYNHPLGDTLRLLLKAENLHYRFRSNYVRPVAARPILNKVKTD